AKLAEDRNRAIGDHFLPGLNERSWKMSSLLFHLMLPTPAAYHWVAESDSPKVFVKDVSIRMASNVPAGTLTRPTFPAVRTSFFGLPDSGPGFSHFSPGLCGSLRAQRGGSKSFPESGVGSPFRSVNRPSFDTSVLSYSTASAYFPRTVTS